MLEFIWGILLLVVSKQEATEGWGFCFCFVFGAFISPTNFDAFLYVSYTFSFMYNVDKILY